MVSTYPLNLLLAKDKGLDEEDNVDTCTKRGFVVNKKIRHSGYTKYLIFSVAGPRIELGTS